MPSKGRQRGEVTGGGTKSWEKWARQVAAGLENCRRCGNLITPDEPWDLDHTDDRTDYYGPSGPATMLPLGTG
jgi:hypothetical protein